MKSWCGMHLVRTALVRGLKVLHISHEMTVEEIEQRYDMMFGAMVSKLEPAKVEYSKYVLVEGKGKLERYTETRPSVFEIDKVREVRKKVERFGGELIIRKYPMGACTMAEIDRYVHYLENYEGFVPDVFFNDYADIMRSPSASRETRHQLNEIYIDHKRLADERNMLVVTVSQARREAIRAARISVKDFAEDIRKAGNIDIGIAVCRTEEQAENDMAVLWVVAGRNVPQDVGCVIGTNLQIGQFCAWDVPYRDFNRRGEEDE